MAYTPSGLTLSNWTSPINIQATDLLSGLDDAVNSIVETHPSSIKNHINTELAKVPTYLNAELVKVSNDAIAQVAVPATIATDQATIATNAAISATASANLAFSITVFKGDWAVGLSYTVGDYVYINDIMYKALQDSTGVNPSTDNGDIWQSTAPISNAIAISNIVDYEAVITTVTANSSSCVPLHISTNTELCFISPTDMFIYNHSAKTKGSVVSAFATNLSANACLLDGNVIVFAQWSNTTTVELVVGSIVDNTLTFGTKVDLVFTSAVSDSIGVKLTKVDTSYVLTAITSTSGAEAFAFTISGTTITTGTKTTIDTNTNASTYPPSIVNPTSATALLVYGNGTTTGRARVMTVSGTTITLGTAATVTVGSTAYQCKILGQFSTGRYLVAYNNDVVMVNISGTTVTFSNALSATSANINKGFEGKTNILLGTNTMAVSNAGAGVKIYTDTAGTLSVSTLFASGTVGYSLVINNSEMFLFYQSFIYKVTRVSDTYSYQIIKSNFKNEWSAIDGVEHGAPYSISSLIRSTIPYASYLKNTNTYKTITSSGKALSVSLVDGIPVNTQVENIFTSYKAKEDGSCAWSIVADTSSPNSHTIKRIKI